MTTPGHEPSGSSPDASSGYEYPSLEKSAPPADPPAAASPGGYPGYPPPGYADPYGYGAYGQTGGTNGLAIASLITSIAAIVTCYLGIILGIVGVILGIVALNQLKTKQQDGKGIAIAGIILGAVIPVLWILVLIVIAAGSSSTSGSF